MSREIERTSSNFAEALLNLVNRSALNQVSLGHDQEVVNFMEALDELVDARVSDALDREHGRGDYRY